MLYAPARELFHTHVISSHAMQQLYVVCNGSSFISLISSQLRYAMTWQLSAVCLMQPSSTHIQPGHAKETHFIELKCMPRYANAKRKKKKGSFVRRPSSTHHSHSSPPRTQLFRQSSQRPPLKSAFHVLSPPSFISSLRAIVAYWLVPSCSFKMMAIL